MRFWCLLDAGVGGEGRGVMHYIRIRTVPPEYCEHKQHQMNNDMSMWPGGRSCQLSRSSKVVAAEERPMLR